MNKWISIIFGIYTALAHAETSTMPCEEVAQLLGHADDLAKISTPQRVLECTGMLLIQVPATKYKDTVIPAHYLITPAIRNRPSELVSSPK